MLILSLLCSFASASLAPTPTASSDCLSHTVCIHGVNSCGQSWETCIPECTPLTYTTPPCSTTITTTSSCSPASLCEDFIDPCGQTYGGCYDICEEKPTWTTPSCSTEPTESLSDDTVGDDETD